MNVGGFMLFGGILILLFLLTSTGKISVIVYCWNGIFIVGGGVRFFTAESQYQDYKLVLQILAEEETIKDEVE